MDSSRIAFTIQESLRAKRLNDTNSLYRRVLNNIRRAYKVEPWRIYRSVFETTLNPSAANQDRFEHCIAHMICHAPLWSELTYTHFSAFFRVHRLLVNELAVVSVNGRGGQDVVGLVNAMAENQVSPRRMAVTLVDKSLKWQLFFSVLVSEALAWGQTTLLSRFLNRTQFEHCFIQSEAGEDLRMAVREAGLIMISLEEEERDPAKDLVEDVAQFMKEGSLLFISFASSALMPDSLFMKGNFKTVYFQHHVAMIGNDSSIMSVRCNTSGGMFAVILQKC